MDQMCEMLDKCGFFRKYRETNELACKGYIQQYCKGSKQEQCRRLEYRRRHNAPPPDDMMPTGVMIAYE